MERIEAMLHYAKINGVGASPDEVIELCTDVMFLRARRDELLEYNNRYLENGRVLQRQLNKLREDWGNRDASMVVLVQEIAQAKSALANANAQLQASVGASGEKERQWESYRERLLGDVQEQAKTISELRGNLKAAEARVTKLFDKAVNPPESEAMNALADKLSKAREDLLALEGMLGKKSRKRWTQYLEDEARRGEKPKFWRVYYQGAPVVNKPVPDMTDWTAEHEMSEDRPDGETLE